jgi:hypothetical protein|tara:strand:+ start:201 stop:710 length:510 start_codon:yes stop_codon:yes gene_type:complete
MQIDKVLVRLRDYDYICDEAIEYLENNILGNGYTYKTCIRKIASDSLIPTDQRRVWLRNARRLRLEPSAIKLGIDALEVDTYRVVIKNIPVSEGSLIECHAYVDNYDWVKFSNVNNATTIIGDVNNFNRAETVIGDVYFNIQELKSLSIAIEGKIEDVSNEFVIWEKIL